MVLCPVRLPHQSHYAASFVILPRTPLATHVLVFGRGYSYDYLFCSELLAPFPHLDPYINNDVVSSIRLHTYCDRLLHRLLQGFPGPPLRRQLSTFELFKVPEHAFKMYIL